MSEDKGYTGPGSGIRKQMMDSESHEYKDFTTKNLEDIMSELMKDKPSFSEMLNLINDDDLIPNPKGLTPEGQIKDGYLYKIGTGKWTAMTGSGGARMNAKNLRERGMSDAYILNSIFLLVDETPDSIPLISLEWKTIPFWKRIINKYFKK